MQLMKPENPKAPKTYLTIMSGDRRHARGITIYEATPQEVMSFLRSAIPDRGKHDRKDKPAHSAA